LASAATAVRGTKAQENEFGGMGRSLAMYKNILIPTDGSDLAGKAVQHGMAFAKEIGAKVTVLTVTVPFHVFTLDPQIVEDTAQQYQKRLQVDTAKLFDAVTKVANAAGVACETVKVEHEHPYQAIIDAAKSKGCDLIVMASHGRRGVSAIVLGSETVKVLTHSKIPVLVHR
jgi:nucleotide-binding universal stress UspA family protein